MMFPRVPATATGRKASWNIGPVPLSIQPSGLRGGWHWRFASADGVLVIVWSCESA